MRPASLEPTSRIAVVGGGVEGRAVVDYLQARGCLDVTICDKNESLELPFGIQGRLGDEYLDGLDRFDVIFRSPGVPRDLASLVDAERRGVVITSATREFFAHCPCTIVGVTGSNGKTTTTELIAGILRSLYGDNLHVGGNDRRPLLADLPRIERDHVVVLELSSFQLQDLGQSPHVAVVLNVTPNHLDVHADFEEYLQAKAQIVRHQTPADYAVLNWSFTRVRELAQQTQAKVIHFNEVDPAEGAFLQAGKLVLRHGGVDEVLLAADGLPYLTNLDNVLAAALVGKLFGVPLEAIRAAVLGFRPVAHRLELVRELDGVRWYDDSASTTPDSSVNAIRSFPEGKVLLLAGGSDKRLGFEILGKEILRTGTRAFLFGQMRGRIADAIHEAGKKLKVEVHVELCDSLEQAVVRARDSARPGDAVVLSPACASFDMFRNAKHRGERFQEIVRGLAPGRA